MSAEKMEKPPPTLDSNNFAMEKEALTEQEKARTMLKPRSLDSFSPMFF